MVDPRQKARNEWLWKKPERLLERGAKSSIFIQETLWQIRAKYSVVILIVGRCRTGKSWLGLSLACLFDPYFIENPIVYYDLNKFFTDFMKGVNKGYRFPNKVFLIDEVGKDLDYREYYSLFNKSFSYVLQTQQIARKIFILVLPHANLLAKAHHHFIDYVIKTTSRGNATIYNVWTDYADMDGSFKGKGVIERMHEFPLPHPKVIKWFEDFEKDRKKEIGQEILNGLIKGKTKTKKQGTEYNMKEIMSSFKAGKKDVDGD